LDVDTVAQDVNVKTKVVQHGFVAVEARVHTRGQTGVEMEALTAVSAACLTVYDMCKAVDKAMHISGTRVVYKAGGKSGVFLDSKFKGHPVNRKFIRTDCDEIKRRPI